MTDNILRRLAVPASVVLISFLGYGSQILFCYIEPGSLDVTGTVFFNVLMICIFMSYLRACFVDPGWVPARLQKPITLPEADVSLISKLRWCRKCNTQKPPRAHHCKICSRCVPKMDHHCPWTINCVSHRTFPHFFRFLLYSVITMTYLEYALLVRAAAVWTNRHQASYLGPSPAQLIFLYVEIIANSLTLSGVGLLFLHNLWCLGANTTTIEGWEIERHGVLARRAKRRGGYLDGPDGLQIRLTKQAFPYDIGIWRNISQGLTGSPLLWLLPFAPTASNESGLAFETNGFDDRPWPPPDPDRIPRYTAKVERASGFALDLDGSGSTTQFTAFRQRQQADSQRRRQDTPHNQASVEEVPSVGQAWKNGEGESLGDFGVDEDDIPLNELLQRKKLEPKLPLD